MSRQPVPRQASPPASSVPSRLSQEGSPHTPRITRRRARPAVADWFESRVSTRCRPPMGRAERKTDARGLSIRKNTPGLQRSCAIRVDPLTCWRLHTLAKWSIVGKPTPGDDRNEEHSAWYIPEEARARKSVPRHSVARLLPEQGYDRDEYRQDLCPGAQVSAPDYYQFCPDLPCGGWDEAGGNGCFCNGGRVA